MGDRVARKRQQGYLFSMARGWIRGCDKGQRSVRPKSGSPSYIGEGHSNGNDKGYGSKYKVVLVRGTRYEGAYRFMQGIG